MKEEYYISLIQKKLRGVISSPETQELEAWLSASQSNRDIAKAVEKAWEFSEGYSNDLAIDLEEDFQKITARLANPSTKVRPLIHRHWLLRIAAVFVLVVGATYFINNYLSPAVKYQVTASQETPSKNPTTLVDGTKVWLNAHSQLTYFTTVLSKERRVKIEGAAYLEVAHDPKKPFIVEMLSGEVRVLGTSFSVSENAEHIEVNVASGKVQLSSKTTEGNIIMLANEKGILDKSAGTLTKEASPLLNELFWHTRQLTFDNTPLEQVLQQITAQYNTSIELEEATLKTCPVTATFKDKSIDTVLETLTTLFSIEVKQNANGGYLLKGGFCQ